MAFSYLLIHPVGYTDINTSRFVFTATLAVKEPQQHLEVTTIGGAVDGNEVVAPSDLVNVTGDRLRRE